MSTVYEIVTERIIAQLEAGTIPWRRPWQGVDMMPANVVSGKPYSGINTILLAFAGYQSPWWATMKQGNKLGGRVRKGERSTMVTFWKLLERTDEAGTKKNVPMLRYYRVFNVEQFEGLELPRSRRGAVKPTESVEPIPVAQAIADGYADGPETIHGGDRAFYTPKADRITLPNPEAFESMEAYWATRFHEMGHSTGHSSRLDRFDGETRLSPFGSPDYSREELVAEFCSAFLSAIAGIDQTTEGQSASYIASWIKRLKDDPKLVVNAAGKGQKAANRILGEPAEG